MLKLLLMVPEIHFCLALESELARSELGVDSFEASHLLLLHYVVLFYCYRYFNSI
jgi:hypothetical protein